MNILNDYYTPQVLEDGYQFSNSDVYFSLPADGGLAGYRTYIKGLPLEEGTDVFSMHDNANITFAQKESQTLFEQLLSLMPKSGGGGGSKAGAKSREEMLLETCTSIQSKIPREFNAEQVLTKYPIQYKESMSTVLNQEVIRYNRLLAVLHSTLAEVIKALKGLVVMSVQCFGEMS